MCVFMKNMTEFQARNPFEFFPVILYKQAFLPRSIALPCGGMAERLIAAVLKTV